MEKIAVNSVAVLSAGIGKIDAIANNLRQRRTIVEYVPTIDAVAALFPEFDYYLALDELSLPAAVRQKAERCGTGASLCVKTAIIAALKAWNDAGLFTRRVKEERVSVIVAGGNYNIGASARAFKRYQHSGLIPASYAKNFTDSNLIGILSEILTIRGEGFVVAAASASGLTALITAYRHVLHGYCDRCLVAAPFTDLSETEIASFKALGVLAGNKENIKGPFDNERCGFFYGQSSGAVILSKETQNNEEEVYIAGGAMLLDANSGTDPNVEGEFNVMRAALRDAGVESEKVDYVNAHATGSIIGDATELTALDKLFGTRKNPPFVNSSKGLIGHCLSAAGTVESIFTIMQLKKKFVHGNGFLNNPILSKQNIVDKTEENADIKIAMKNSFGFGGINSCIIFKKGNSL